MFTDPIESSAEVVRLRQQAHYWRSLHAAAVPREAAAKEKILQLEQKVRQQESEIQELRGQLEKLEAERALLRQMIFGQKSEQSPPSVAPAPEDPPPPNVPAGPQERRKRGKQPGSRGYGRKRRDELPTEEMEHHLPCEQHYCPQCGKPLQVFPGTEDSQEIEWEVRLFRRIHKRTRYRPTCHCGAVPGILTAPPPPKLIPKGLFSIGFWVQVLLEKFLLQRPLYRIGQRLLLHGLDVSQSTLTGGLQRMVPLFQPLYAAFLEHNRAAHHWHMDETRWMVFEELEGKSGHRWWLWVVVTAETCVYLLDPSRSSQVPKNHLGPNPKGILNVDRYAAYKAFQVSCENLRLAYCWSHVRRDFVRIRDGYPRLHAWSHAWVENINALFDHNAQRLQVRSQADPFAVQDRLLREQLNTFQQTCEQELAQSTLHPMQRKVLESLRNHWPGLTVFVDHPEIPMDNNEAERRLRNPVVGRKNYYGSGSLWSGMLSAMLFTIFQTLLLNRLDPQKYLTAYFEACAQNTGRPLESVEAFLPWKLSEEQKTAWRYRERPP